MGHIMTVLGPCAPDDLGFCHSHDHLSVAAGRSCVVDPNLRIDDTARTAQELFAFRQAGGAAVADAQPVGCGREALVQVELARRSGIHIIASTGFHELRFYPTSHWLFSLEQTALESIFVRELTQGMFLCCDTALPRLQCPAKAGFIKTALTADLTPRHQLLFQAAAGAQRSTGAPLMVHCGPGAEPLALSDRLSQWGVSPDRVAFCHLDRTEPDLELHKELLHRGHYLEYDTIGRPKYHSDDVELQIVHTMVEAGFDRQLLMGLDSTRARLQSYGGSPGLCHILQRFIPLLVAGGIGQSEIRYFFYTNPAHYFSIQ